MRSSSSTHRAGGIARRWLLASVLALLGLAPLVAAAQTRAPEVKDPDVARVEAYLNGIKSFKGRFLQVGPDGGIAQGQVFMRRPGNMRFQYDPPTPLLIVADGTWLVIWDKKLDQVDRVPLSSTPIDFLVQREVKLTGRVRVKSVEKQTGLLALTVYDNDRKDDGEITLIFNAEPLDLRQWVVTDTQGLQTRVSLFEVESNIPLDIKLFVFTDSGPSIP